MRVGLNLLYLIPGVVGGTETYARELINSLVEVVDPSSLVVFVNQEAANFPLPIGIRRVVCRVRGRPQWQRYLYEQVVLPFVAHGSGVDLLHSLAYVGPVFPMRPSVVTVHDLNFLAVGASMSWRRRLALRLFVTLSIRTATRVVTDSYSSARQILTHMPAARDKVTVVPLGGEHRLRRNTAAQSDRAHQYFLAFSSRSPHKNLGTLLNAFRLASANEGFRHELRIIGDLTPEDAGSARTMSGVRLLGYVSDDEVSRLLSGADFLLVPSIYEGFGLPVVEALWFGVPSLLADRTALPEVGGDAAILFNPDDWRHLATLLSEVAADPKLREELARRAHVRARQFSWATTAQQMVVVYEACLTRERRAR